MRNKTSPVFRLFGLILAIFIAVFGVLWIKHYIEEKIVDPLVEDAEEVLDYSDTTQPPEDTIKIESHDEAPIWENAGFFEKQPKIEGQQAYIAIPLSYNPDNLPKIVVYSHGSDTTITTNMDSEFMSQMRDYAVFFTSNNYIFAASAMHGANWGSDSAVDAMLKMINWIQADYHAQDEVNLLGFSMGGLAVFKFAFEYPDMVSHLASLAGTTRPKSWTDAQIQLLQAISVKIWHGDRDVNVPYSLSQSFVAKCEKNDVFVELRTVDDGTHYDVDWEFHGEILEFFEF